MTSTFPKGHYILSDTMFSQNGEWQDFLRFMSENSTDSLDKSSPIGLRICEYRGSKIALFVLSRAFIYVKGNQRFSATKGMMVLFPTQLLSSACNGSVVVTNGIDHILEMPKDFDVTVKGTTICLGKHSFIPQTDPVPPINTTRIVGRTTGDFTVQLGWFSDHFEWDKPISTRLKWSKSRKTIRLAEIPLVGDLKTLAESKQPLEFANFVSTGAYAGVYLRRVAGEDSFVAGDSPIISPVMRIIEDDKTGRDRTGRDKTEDDKIELSVRFSQSLTI